MEGTEKQIINTFDVHNMEGSFIDRLRTAMDIRNMSAAELSRQSGLSDALISGYRNGRQEPKKDKLTVMAKALNVSPCWLMGYSCEMQNNNIIKETSQTAKTDIGQRIKNRRTELGLTQEELARRLGNKTRASVCTVEKGKEDLTTERINKYAEALETTSGYLIGLAETPCACHFEPSKKDQELNTPTISTKMGQRIKEKRKEKKYTLEELGTKLGVQKSAVSKWERGEVVNIKQGTLKNLCSILDCSPQWLLGLESTEYINNSENDYEKTAELLTLFHKISDNDRQSLIDFAYFLAFRKKH